ncbi:MAG: hypothetical protein Q4C13_08090 [Clostridia bacterium]|nr:hypothetical protein [Clostridia bacterium]
MKRLLSRMAMAAAALTLAMLLDAGAALAASVTVNTAEELAAALANGGATEIVLGANLVTSGDIDVPAGKTVYLNGKTWNIGDGAVSGAVDASTDGSYILRTQAGSVSGVADGKVFVAYALQLGGAADGEMVTGLWAGGAALTLYSPASVLSGSATVYVSAAELGALAGGVSEVTTDAGAYAQSASGGLARAYAVSYSDVVDASGQAPLQASDAAQINAARFTAADTTLTLLEPTLAGYRFLGWTWTGQTTLAAATGAAQTVSVAGLTGLSVTAHWEQLGGGMGGGRSAGAPAAAAQEETETEQDAAQTGEQEDGVSAGQGGRVSRGSASTKVVFTNGSAASATLPTAESVGGRGFPWGWAAAGAAAAALACGILARALRRRRRAGASEE